MSRAVLYFAIFPPCSAWGGNREGNCQISWEKHLIRYQVPIWNPCWSITSWLVGWFSPTHMKNLIMASIIPYTIQTTKVFFIVHLYLPENQWRQSSSPIVETLETSEKSNFLDVVLSWSEETSFLQVDFPQKTNMEHRENNIWKMMFLFNTDDFQASMSDCERRVFPCLGVLMFLPTWKT